MRPRGPADVPGRDADASASDAPAARGGAAAQLTPQPGPRQDPESVSVALRRWLESDRQKTLGGLIDLFGEKSFAIIFVVLLGVPALPLPTGGATHVFEVIAVVLALQLIAGREELWIPRRWRDRELAGEGQQKFIGGLMKTIAWLERFSKPRMRWLFNRRLSNVAFGIIVACLSVGAFLAPPFTGLDTLPAMGAVLVSLGVLLEDALFVLVGLIVGAIGVALEFILGKAAVKGIGGLF
jgi:hypothetical protein